MVSYDCCTSATSSTYATTYYIYDYDDATTTTSSYTGNGTASVITTSDWYATDYCYHYQAPAETKEEKAERLKKEAEERAKQQAKDKARQKAEEKAVKLLESLIGDEIEVYKKTGRIFVKGKKGTYIVRKGRFVQKIEDDKIIDLCVHIKSSYKCPKTDNVIALKMLLENDEDHVLKLANRIGSESLPDQLPLAACM